MWIKVDQALITHRKTFALADALDISTAEAVGILIGIWTWGLDNADENGYIGDVRSPQLAYVCGYEGNPALMLDGLLESGYLEYAEDGGLRIHDWAEYGGEFQTERKRIQEKTAKMREAKAQKALTKNSYKEDLKTSYKELLEDTPKELLEDTSKDGIDKIREDKIREDNIIRDSASDGADDTSKPTPEELEAKKKKLQERNHKAMILEFFEQVWEHYPKKKNKENARNTFIRLDPDADLKNDMIAAIDEQKNTKQWKEDGGKYIPYLSTWINGRRWEDEITVDRDTKSDTNKETGSFQTDEFFAKAQARAEKVMRGGEAV